MQVDLWLTALKLYGGYGLIAALFIYGGFRGWYVWGWVHSKVLAQLEESSEENKRYRTLMESERELYLTNMLKAKNVLETSVRTTEAIVKDVVASKAITITDAPGPVQGGELPGPDDRPPENAGGAQAGDGEVPEV
jgi:hypothetical protein